MEAGAILLFVILTWPSLHSERLLTQVLAFFPHNTTGTYYVSEKLINSVSKFLSRFCSTFRVTLSEHLDTCNLPVKHETMSLSDFFHMMDPHDHNWGVGYQVFQGLLAQKPLLHACLRLHS
jgi:hypothetical protein